MFDMTWPSSGHALVEPLPSARFRYLQVPDERRYSQSIDRRKGLNTSRFGSTIVPLSTRAERPEEQKIGLCLLVPLSDLAISNGLV